LSSKTETGIGALWPASSTLTWGCLQFYAGTASDELEARYYNSNFGRFWSPDPKGVRAAHPRRPISWNRYIYASDDPVNRVDPSGRDDFLDEDGLVFWDQVTASGDGGGGGGAQCTESGATCVPPPGSTTNPCTSQTGCSGSGSSAAGGSSPTGGPPTPGAALNPLTIPGFLQAEALALSALATPQCGALFGLAPGSMSPGALLAGGVAAAATGGVSALSFSTNTTAGEVADTDWAGTTVVTSDPWAYVNANGQRIESTRVVISINVANWDNLTPILQAQDLIHELGHAFDELIGAGGSAFVNDVDLDGNPIPAAEATNASLVQQCIHN
jgi:RHS repeat-associated protein